MEDGAAVARTRTRTARPAVERGRWRAVPQPGSSTTSRRVVRPLEWPFRATVAALCSHAASAREVHNKPAPGTSCGSLSWTRRHGQADRRDRKAWQPGTAATRRHSGSDDNSARPWRSLPARSMVSQRDQTDMTVSSPARPRHMCAGGRPRRAARKCSDIVTRCSAQPRSEHKDPRGRLHMGGRAAIFFSQRQRRYRRQDFFRAGCSLKMRYARGRVPGSRSQFPLRDRLPYPRAA